MAQARSVAVAAPRAAAANPIDITMFGKNFYKKSVSLMSAVIRPTSLSSKDGLVTSGTVADGDKLILAHLPAECIVTNAMLYIRKAPSATNSQITVKVGTDEIIAATAVGSSSNKVVGTFANRVPTGTGADVIAEIGTADLTDGEVEVVVEYYEITRTVGEYTL